MGTHRGDVDKQDVRREQKRGVHQYAVKSACPRHLLLILLLGTGTIPHADSRGDNAQDSDPSCPTMDRCCCLSSRILGCGNFCRMRGFPCVEPLINANTVRELYLTGNNISNIQAGCFEGYDHLEILFLDHNKLTCLERGTFLGARNLVSLEIHWNRLIALQSGTFDGLSNLQKLHLDNNMIEYLPDGIFSDMLMLKQLMLQSNYLHDRSLPKGLLKNLTSLEVLSMSNNHLTTLPSDFFQGLSRLRKVSLEQNLLTAVNMQQWPNVAYVVDLRHNPLVRIINVPERMVHLKVSLHYLQCTCENERALVLTLSHVHQGIESHCSNLSCISQTSGSLSVLEEIRQDDTRPTSSAPSSRHWWYAWLYLSVGLLRIMVHEL